MKEKIWKKVPFLLIFIVLFQFCSQNNSSENDKSDTNILSTSSVLEDSNSQNQEENQVKDNSAESVIADIESVIKEYPNGVLSFLSNKEKKCIAKISTTEQLFDMEKGVSDEGAITKEQNNFFSECNIPSPPGLPIKDTNSSANISNEPQASSYQTSFASIENITSLEMSGVSPYLEVIDNEKLRLFFNSIEIMGLGVSICDYELNCELQGVLQRISDLTLINTNDGIRRGYYVTMNPQTNQKDIYTAVFSDDGLSFSNEVPLGFPVDKDEVAWGVPDAVKLPNGLIRIYWVFTEDKTSDEKIVSATSKTTKGIEFIMDPGYRLDNGYVDFEVIKAEDGDWRALMSFTPHYVPEIPQSLFYATSKDGLDWELNEERISPEDYSYLDPTAISLNDNTYLIVVSGAPNKMGDRKHSLYRAELRLP